MNKDTHTQEQYMEEFRRLLHVKYNIDIDSGALQKMHIISRKSYVSGEQVEGLVSKTAEMFGLVERR